jgi:hypothetical protein
MSAWLAWPIHIDHSFTFVKRNGSRELFSETRSLRLFASSEPSAVRALSLRLPFLSAMR